MWNFLINSFWTGGLVGVLVGLLIGLIGGYRLGKRSSACNLEDLLQDREKYYEDFQQGLRNQLVASNHRCRDLERRLNLSVYQIPEPRIIERPKYVYLPSAKIEVERQCTESLPCTCCKNTEIFFPPYTNYHRSKNVAGLSLVGQNIVASLREAKLRIRLVLYRLTFQQFTNTLIEAHNRGVEVKVLADSPQQCNDRDSRGHLAEIRRLSNQGIVVKTTVASADNNGLTHSKFVVIDIKQLIHGSMNWTYFGQFRNNEQVMFSKSSKTIQLFARHFDDLWHKGSPMNCR